MSQTDKLWLDDAPPKGKFRYIDLYAVGETALDIGCGLGWCSDYLRKKGLEVIALDVDDDFQYHDTIRFVQASADSLPFDDKSFDTVLAFDVIEHIKDDKKVWAEIARVTRKRLLMSVPSSQDELLRKYNLTYKHHIDKSHHREYSLDEVKQKLESHGFRVIYLDKQGPVDPRVIAQFLKPNRWISFYEKLVNLGLRLGLIKNCHFFADIYAVSEKIN